MTEWMGTTAYEKLIHAQNNEVLRNSKDIEKDFENVVDKAKSDNDWWIFGNKLSSDAAETYKDILNNEDSIEALNNALNDSDTWKSGVRLMSSDIKALADLLEENGLEREGTFWNPELDEEYVKRALLKIKI